MQGQAKPKHPPLPTHTTPGKSSDDSAEEILERFDLSLGHLRTSCIGQCIVVMQQANERGTVNSGKTTHWSERLSACDSNYQHFDRSWVLGDTLEAFLCVAYGCTNQTAVPGSKILPLGARMAITRFVPYQRRERSLGLCGFVSISFPPWSIQL